uniref:Putative secreted peptide n=1 Tax=Anopheles braziliensis TaxID=58242 RepID=A0A2M3ZUS7_9DIPT
MGAPSVVATVTSWTAVFSLLMKVGASWAVACVTSKYLDSVRGFGRLTYRITNPALMRNTSRNTIIAVSQSGSRSM